MENMTYKRAFWLGATRSIRAENARLKSELAKVTAERDTAIEDINQTQYCRLCINYETDISEKPCKSCIGFSEKPNFKWRGLTEQTKQEVNDNG